MSEARRFFEPQLADLHPPTLMLGMEAAVARILEAVNLGEPILIYGDYDVDGTTATVLLKTAIDRVSPRGRRSLTTWHVPHRIRDGYGMRGSRLAEATAAGIRLVISVDTGIRAFEAAVEAKTLGLDLIITDHHLPDDLSGVPEGVAVLNPLQPGCAYPFKGLCGAAVAFKLAQALLLDHARAQPDPDTATKFVQDRLIPSLLKLVALATIADSVPLLGENRTIAMLGLRELANPVQPGLRALMQIAGLSLETAPSASDIGYRLGPRINAAGRMEVADDVIELLLTRSGETAERLAGKLDSLNEERRMTERTALDAVERQLQASRDSEGQYPAECLILDSPDWHRGVLGILASRVVERTGRPALVITHNAGEAHGSGRSIDGFHLLDSLTRVHELEDEGTPARTLLTRFGGHAHAVGLTLDSDRLSLLRSRMRLACQQMFTPDCLTPALFYDAEIVSRDLTRSLAMWVERCGPFGNSHREPVFVMRSCALAGPVRVIKDRHICLPLEVSSEGSPVQALGWSRMAEWAERASAMNLGSGSCVDLAFRLRWKESSWFCGFEFDLVAMRAN